MSSRRFSPVWRQITLEGFRFCRIGNNEHDIEIMGYADVRRLTDGGDFQSRQGHERPFGAVARVGRYASRRLTARIGALSSAGRTQRFTQSVRSGDVLVNLGASWSHRNFARTVNALKRAHGLRFALLIHDVLPVSHPGYVDPGNIPVFSKWLTAMAQIWDCVMTPSKSSAAALANHLTAQGLAVPAIAVIPFGAGFGIAAPQAEDEPSPKRTHVLYVSTIEIRKNHMLLFRVWERLIGKYGAAHVPDLIFAGKYGWEINDLRQALKQTGFLCGKIRVVQNLSDSALASLYRSSLFTVFPSFCEGWGLPVAESLFYGRPCIASDSTSVPEVGGRFVQYHDPRDVDHAMRLIEAFIVDRDSLAARERLIRNEYRPPRWDDTAHSIVAAIDAILQSSVRG